jgi:hypothetical protein
MMLSRTQDMQRRTVTSSWLLHNELLRSGRKPQWCAGGCCDVSDWGKTAEDFSRQRVPGRLFGNQRFPEKLQSAEGPRALVRKPTFPWEASVGRGSQGDCSETNVTLRSFSRQRVPGRLFGNQRFPEKLQLAEGPRAIVRKPTFLLEKVMEMSTD